MLKLSRLHSLNRVKIRVFHSKLREIKAFFSPHLNGTSGTVLCFGAFIWCQVNLHGCNDIATQTENLVLNKLILQTILPRKGYLNIFLPVKTLWKAQHVQEFSKFLGRTIQIEWKQWFKWLLLWFFNLSYTPNVLQCSLHLQERLCSLLS